MPSNIPNWLLQKLRKHRTSEPQGPSVLLVLHVLMPLKERKCWTSLLWLVGIFFCCNILTYNILWCLSIQIMKSILTGSWSWLECAFYEILLRVCIVCPGVLHKGRDEHTKFSGTIWRTAWGRKSYTCSVPFQQSPACELSRPTGTPRLCSEGNSFLYSKINSKNKEKLWNLWNRQG